MCRKDRFHQFGLSDFNQPFGLKMNPENRWIKKSETIPWEEIEDRYAELFKSSTGMPANVRGKMILPLTVSRFLHLSVSKILHTQSRCAVPLVPF